MIPGMTQRATVRAERRFAAYNVSDRPLCDLCGAELHKYAVFLDRLTGRCLCAWDTVTRLKLSLRPA